MDLIIAANSVPLSGADTAPATGTPQYATNGSADPLVLPTAIPAYHYNSLTAEIVNLIKALGGTPDKAVWNQLATLLPAYFAATSQITTFTSIGVAGTYTLQAPEWATRVEVIAVGGGGRGAACGATALSGSMCGSGGGSGGFGWGVYPVTGGASYQAVVGAQGLNASADGNGGASSFGPVSGDAMVTAGGGQAGAFQSAGFSAGGSGGEVSGGTIMNNTGASGSDGQAGENLRGFGNGGSGPWGGGGRAGQGGDAGASIVDGQAPGAGGGGAYDWTLSGNTYSGGNGAAGIVLYRWLP
ncbi:glycine-rich domain-containing protein [Gluconobacter morbifer]|uniref:Glycine-rich domain-containing protein n=1 Tax=Gluconobacter morbifer G707 TaxID=1088869 RepID=G6XKV8_9PROT|nr:hypothetical protein [Gluconobacter morbifer]EHH67553.1 hypothetical protein GMO_21240 [Gluconobacter morbifer G707]